MLLLLRHPLGRTDAHEDRLAGRIRGELLGADRLAEGAQAIAAQWRPTLRPALAVCRV